MINGGGWHILRVVIMTRTRPTACPGSGGGRLQRRVSAGGVTCNVDRRGKLNGDHEEHEEGNEAD